VEHPEDNSFAALQHAMISLSKYRLVLASPGLGYLFAASIIGRLPIGMSGLSILLLVQGTSGSFATGGAATVASSQDSPLLLRRWAGSSTAVAPGQSSSRALFSFPRGSSRWLLPCGTELLRSP